MPFRFIPCFSVIPLVIRHGNTFSIHHPIHAALILCWYALRSKGAGLVNCDPDRNVTTPSHTALKPLESKGSGSVTLFTTLRHYCALLMKKLPRDQLQEASAALQKVCDSGECCTQLGKLVFGDAKSNTMHMQWTLMGVAVLMRTKWLGNRKGSKVPSITFGGSTVHALKQHASCLGKFPSSCILSCSFLIIYLFVCLFVCLFR